MRRLMVLLAALMLPLSSLHAEEAKPLADDPAVEARVQKLGEELRCLVCQNQNIADSHADLAMDLKKQLREQIAAGHSDREIKDFMVERYGDFVLYRPPVKPTTWLLWGGPFVLMVGGVIALIAFLRRRKPAEANLTPEEQRRADALIKGDS